MQVSVDGDTGQTIISGMGELHLDIYVERMRREYKVRMPTPCSPCAPAAGSCVRVARLTLRDLPASCVRLVH